MPNTLFVVDDSATMRKVFELTFAGEEITVVTHDGGDGLLAKVRESRPQVVIVDVSLPGTSGYDVVRSIRAEGGLGPVPIYLLYSEHSALDEPAARSCGAVGAIVKPFETQVLIDKVRQALTAANKSPVASPTGNVTAPFGNPQPTPAPIGAIPPAPARAADASFSAPRAGGILGNRPPTGATPAAATATPAAAARPASPAAAPSAGTPGPAAPAKAPPPYPARAPASPPAPVATTISHAVKPVEKPAPVVPIAEAEVAFEPAPEKPVEKPAPVAAAKPTTVHDKPTAPVLPVPSPVADAADKAVAQQLSGLGLTPAQVEAVRALTRDVVERVVWEVVPQLAETMIREELARLTAD